MLILKRDLNQAILIDDVEVFLIAASSGMVELLLLGLPGERLRRLTLRKGEAKTISESVSTSLLEGREGKARLGVDAPNGTVVRRAELRV